MLNIIQGANKKEAIAQHLIKLFTDSNLDGYLYIGYPIFGTDEGIVQIDALLISPQHGFFPINFISNENEANCYEEIQDDNYSKLHSRFFSSKNLVNKRDLLFEILPISYNPSKFNTKLDNGTILNDENIVSYISKSTKSLSESIYNSILSSIQAVSNIRKIPHQRKELVADSRGTKLESLENSIAVMDKNQSKAVIETVNGVQRIRGLAGSGKTIVLASKAAYLHSTNPEWKIAVSFNTRSLKEQFKRLITKSCIEQTHSEPNWNNLHIIHAWGSPGSFDEINKNGIYSIFCNYYGIDYYDVNNARKVFGQDANFEDVCKKALNDIKEFNEREGIYDLILIDEAQDLSPAFLKICYLLLKKPKRLVYAYDELQNLKKATLPPPEEIFGVDKNGLPLVQFKDTSIDQPQQDIILKCCYRNSRPILVTAHALGFGIYRKPSLGQTTGIVQLFHENHLWDDVGYYSDSGTIKDGEFVKLERNADSSPKFLENHSPIEDLIKFEKFNNIEEQNAWLVKAIKNNIQNDQLTPNDIIVINPNPYTTRNNVGPIRAQLFQMNINSHLAGVDTSPDIFYHDENSVVFSGIYRAKGNEAGMVYIINADDCYSENENASIAVQRNRLFTAITRSKAWVRVLGIGQKMQALIEEFEQTKNNNFSLSFKYPTKEERRKINLINRDRTQAEKRAVNKQNNNLEELITSFHNGSIVLEDLNPELIAQLKKILPQE